MAKLRGVATWVVALVVLVAVAGVGAYLYTTYVNSQGSVVEGSDVIGTAAVTFSGSFNAGSTKVGLSNGYTATVNWDDKAVGVVGIAGRYISIKGEKYYVSYSTGYGVKAKNNCPWYAPITGATLYDVVFQWYSASRSIVDGPEYVELEYSSDLEASLKVAGVKFTIIDTGNRLLIRIPIKAVKYNLKGFFDFYYGSTGFLGGCPQLNYHHSGTAYGTVTFASN